MSKESHSAVDRDLEELIGGCKKHPQLVKCLPTELRDLETSLKSLRTARAHQLALQEKSRHATQTCSMLTQQAKDAAASVRDGAVWYLGRYDERLADLGIKAPKDRRHRARRRI